MPAIYQHRLVVADEDIDAFGHANNLRVLGWTLDAASAHIAAAGWPPERFVERGSAFVVRSHRIRYLRPALLGQRIVVETWIADQRAAASLRKYRLLLESDGEDDGTVIARAETDWAYIDLGAGSPRPIEDDIIAAFELVDA